MSKKLFSLVLSMLLAPAIATSAATPADAAPSSKALEGVSAVSAGSVHTCAVAKKRAYCWGGNYGQLGDGTVTESKVPIRVYGLRPGVRGIAAGADASCATTRTEVKCWGEIKGSGGYAYTPRSVIDADAPVTAISIGDGSYFGMSNSLCAVIGATIGCRDLAPDERLNSVSGLGGEPTTVSAGRPNCAIVTGAAKCWGTGSASFSPTTVTGLGQNVAAVVSGKQHSCAVVEDAAKCWGVAWGNPTPLRRSEELFDVPGLGSGVTAIAVGDQFSCAIVNGGVKCWGWNFRGQLGDGTLTDSASPVSVKGLSQGVTAITAGGMHACAIASGRLKCWGTNANGQLGNGKPGARGIDASTDTTTVAAPGRTIRVRGHRKATASVDPVYDDGGVSVDVSYAVPKHMWVKDACVGSVSISVSGNGFKKVSRRARFRYANLACTARTVIAPRAAAREAVDVRVSSSGRQVLKPTRIKRTVEYYQCDGRGCP